MWILWALLSAAFAGVVTIFGKLGVQGVDSTLATTVRAGIMFAFLILASLALGKGTLLSSIQQRPLIFIALSGIAGALSWLFYFLALQQGPATVVAVLDRLSIVFILILSVLFLGEQFSWRLVVGVLLVISGAVVVVLPNPGKNAHNSVSTPDASIELVGRNAPQK